jgi:hypothetical protein
MVRRDLTARQRVPPGYAPAHAWDEYVVNGRKSPVRIGGGTDEVQKNTIGERVLGLPREPSDDREAPWRELARS